MDSELKAELKRRRALIPLEVRRELRRLAEEAVEKLTDTPSVSMRADRPSCAYNGANGTHCLVGHMFQVRTEHIGIGEVVRENFPDLLSAAAMMVRDILVRLQIVHDNCVDWDALSVKMGERWIRPLQEVKDDILLTLEEVLPTDEMEETSNAD